MNFPLRALPNNGNNLSMKYLKWWQFTGHCSPQHYAMYVSSIVSSNQKNILLTFKILYITIIVIYIKKLSHFFFFFFAIHLIQNPQFNHYALFNHFLVNQGRKSSFNQLPVLQYLCVNYLELTTKTSQLFKDSGWYANWKNKRNRKTSGNKTGMDGGSDIAQLMGSEHANSV